MFCFFFTTSIPLSFFFFFFNDTATTEIYTLSLHDALPILFRQFQRHRERRSGDRGFHCAQHNRTLFAEFDGGGAMETDRKSTRLNSSHLVISYAVFCLKKKKNHKILLDLLIHSEHDDICIS